MMKARSLLFDCKHSIILNVFLFYFFFFFISHVTSIFLWTIIVSTFDVLQAFNVIPTLFLLWNTKREQISRILKVLFTVHCFEVRSCDTVNNKCPLLGFEILFYKAPEEWIFFYFIDASNYLLENFTVSCH